MGPTRESSARPDVSEVEQELTRILGSSQFASAGRLAAFLEYVVRKTLAGQADDIKEYAVGTGVFERPDSFDPRLDTIVRVQASKLRSRLSEYYATAGADDPVIIDLPRGSYVPTFSSKTPKEIDISRPRPVPSWQKRALLPWAVAAIAALCALAYAFSGALGPRVRSQAIRFPLAPPENKSFNGVPSVSHDGRNLLSIVANPDGTTSLWVRPLEAASGQILPGTETVNNIPPSWSADGRFILFYDGQGKLKRADLAGAAPPEVVSGAEPAWGADCNRDNVIVLGCDRGIVRISPSGEASSPVTHLDASHQEIAHYWPRFLPDGRHFLYFARSRKPEENAICVASLDGKIQKRLLLNSSFAQYGTAAPDRSNGAGYLLYVRGRSLVAHRFNPKTLMISGDPHPIAEGVPRLRYGLARFTVSDNGVLAYRTDPGGLAQLAWFDRAGKPQGTLGPPGMYGDPAISPDGRRVAFDLIEGFNQDIWVVDLASGRLSRLTFDPEVDHVPVWSPDGSRIAFDSHRSGLGDLYVKAASGAGSDDLLLHWNESTGAQDWTRDGRFLMFGSWTPKHRGDLWILPMGGDRKPVPYLRTDADESGVFSPDSKWIAYTSDESGEAQVYVQGFRGASPATGSKWQISIGGGSQPAWRADGKELFYLAADNKMMSVDIHPGATFETGPLRALFDTHLTVRRGPRNVYAASPDGRRFLLRMPSAETSGPIHVFVNWAAALRR